MKMKPRDEIETIISKLDPSDWIDRALSHVTRDLFSVVCIDLETGDVSVDTFPENIRNQYYEEKEEFDKFVSYYRNRVCIYITESRMEFEDEDWEEHVQVEVMYPEFLDVDADLDYMYEQRALPRKDLEEIIASRYSYSDIVLDCLRETDIFGYADALLDPRTGEITTETCSDGLTSRYKNPYVVVYTSRDETELRQCSDADSDERNRLIEEAEGYADEVRILNGIASSLNDLYYDYDGGARKRTAELFLIGGIFFI